MWLLGRKWEDICKKTMGIWEFGSSWAELRSSLCSLNSCAPARNSTRPTELQWKSLSYFVTWVTVIFLCFLRIPWKCWDFSGGVLHYGEISVRQYRSSGLYLSLAFFKLSEAACGESLDCFFSVLFCVCLLVFGFAPASALRLELISLVKQELKHFINKFCFSICYL